MSPSPPVAAPRREDLNSIRRRLYLSMGFFVAAALVGAPWDRLWHWTHPLDEFASAPHVFMYSMAGLAAASAASVGFSPRLRPLLGRGFQLFGVPFEVPGPLLLLGGGLACVMLAGLVDSQWHGAFGIDETSWSTPHAMLWWGFLVGTLGYLSCRMALVPWCPMSAASKLSFGTLALCTVLTVTVGPFAHNNSPESVRAIASIPAIAGQGPAQHLYRIYEEWHIDRTNPVYPLLAGLATGIGFALLRGLERRPSFLLGATLLATGVGMAYDFSVASALDLANRPANWLPLPIVAAAGVLILLQRRALNETLAFAGAGLAFGLLCALAWSPNGFGFALAAIASPAMVGGSRVGQWIWSVVESPTQRGLSLIVPTLGLAVPLVTGALDLYLRLNTP